MVWGLFPPMLMLTDSAVPGDTTLLLDCISSCFRFSPGSTVVCVFGVLQGGMGMGQSATYGEAVAAARAAAVQIYRVIERVPSIDSRTGGETPHQLKGDIVLREVGLQYLSHTQLAVLWLGELFLPVPAGRPGADQSQPQHPGGEDHRPGGGLGQREEHGDPAAAAVL